MKTYSRIWRDPCELNKHGVSTSLLDGELRGGVERENYDQLRKWGRQEHTVAEWAVILSEEVGELMKELCEEQFRVGLNLSDDYCPEADDYLRHENIQSEAIQVITLAAKIFRMAAP